MTKHYTIRVTRLTVTPQNQPIYSELATDISIDDEAAGEFVTIRQTASCERGEVKVSPEEWPFLMDAIDRMVAGCRPTDPSESTRSQHEET